MGPVQSPRGIRRLLVRLGIVVFLVASACEQPRKTAPVGSDPLAETPGEIPRSPDASRWPEFLGPTRDGRSGQDSRLEEADSIKLEPLWRRSLGSGYSGISVDEGRLFTMFTDGDSDILIGLDSDTGKEIWRQRLAPTVRDNGGADDGPLSTPAVEAGVVFALGPSGQLVAVSAVDGSIRWRRELVEELGAHVPEFLLTTSPMLAGGHLVVPIGSREHGLVCGLDPQSGETRWCVGKGTVTYQSPTRMKLLGKPWIVALSDSHVLGLEPATGQLQWMHEYNRRGEESAAHALAAGTDRLLIQGAGGYALYQASEDLGEASFQLLWKNKEFHQNFDFPIYHGGYLYGFGGRVLICLDAQTGERLWRSTATRGGNGILIGPFLVIWSPKGRIHVAKASPEGYVEVASKKLLEEGGYTAPSYADGVLFVRNLEEIAAVRVVPSPGP